MTVPDGPYTVTIPEDCKLDRVDILIGLHKGGRIPLKGVSVGSQRVVIGRLAVTREKGKIVGIRIADIDDLRRKQQELQKRFTDRMNTAAKSIDFGPGATDGSFKLLTKKDHLDLLPYPRDRRFSVEMNINEVLPGTSISTVRIVGLGSDGKELGQAAPKLSKDRLKFHVAIPGTARYVIEY